jgi:hypothetical protein
VFVAIREPGSRRRGWDEARKETFVMQSSCVGEQHSYEAAPLAKAMAPAVMALPLACLRCGDWNMTLIQYWPLSGPTLIPWAAP